MGMTLVRLNLQLQSLTTKHSREWELLLSGLAYQCYSHYHPFPRMGMLAVRSWEDRCSIEQRLDSTNTYQKTKNGKDNPVTRS